MSLLVKVNQSDNVAIAVQPLTAGTEIEGLHINQDIPQAHKVALADIPKGSPVIRYGVILGYAMNPIRRGDWINEFMLELPTPPSVDDMEYGKNIVTELPDPPVTTFEGYVNSDGGYAGTRNILGISTTVQCVTGVLNVAVKRMKEELLPKYPNVDDIVPINHAYGCGVAINAPEASDIIRALERELKKAGAKIHLHTAVQEIVKKPVTDSVNTLESEAALTESGYDAGKSRKGKKLSDIPQEKITGVILTDGTFMEGDAVIVATGGFSYQSTGSTGDGYRFARELGLKVTDIAPSLVPLKTKEDYVPKLQGLSLKNTGLTIKNGKKVLYEDFGEMMFTHFGVTGPMILSASAHIGAKLAKAPNGELSAYLDLKPALTREQLDARILREFEAGPNKQFKNVIGVLFPSSLTPVMLELGGIPAEKKIHDISREERQHFIDLIKAFPFTITGMGEFKEAIITRGGVSVKEINPGTMEVKKISGLYFAGEVLDLDAVTGGYNLQIAWSTAYLAAQAIRYCSLRSQ